MKTASLLLIAGLALTISGAGVWAITPYVFADRVIPGYYVGELNLAGVSGQDIQGVIRQHATAIVGQPLTLELRGRQVSATLADLGISVDVEATAERAFQAAGPPRGKITLAPSLRLDYSRLRQQIETDFAEILDIPQNASLIRTPTDTFALIPGKEGEQIDSEDLKAQLESHLQTNAFTQPITLTLKVAPPPVEDSEVEAARALAARLLAEGFHLTFESETFELTPFTIRRLLTFVESIDPADPTNRTLGIELEPAGLRDYLTNTLKSEIDQPPVNARLALSRSEDEEDDTPRVTQFASPQRGQELSIEESAAAIERALATGQIATSLVVNIVEPEIAEVADIKVLGIDTLLAAGESDFKGSPRNRIHNITVGASRYHGLLIPPGAEFSFNEFLGPVNAATGFKPELVIKENVTKPEYGGGLCQVSTTAFRAALRTGLPIVERRNHSYAVAYYGTPGFDATIYPGHTDLRFLNNTPGHILIQVKQEGTKLAFEFWGTTDGREVEIDGPHPYGRQPDGAVKATLTQVVRQAGEIVIEDTFYSNYKSPKLFPKVLAANGEPTPAVASATTNENQPTPTPTPTPTKPKPTPRPTPTPKS